MVHTCRYDGNEIFVDGLCRGCWELQEWHKGEVAEARGNNGQVVIVDAPPTHDADGQRHCVVCDKALDNGGWYCAGCWEKVWEVEQARLTALWNRAKENGNGHQVEVIEVAEAR